MISAVVVAAGKGTRMGIVENKIFCRIGNKPVLAHTLSIFDESEDISEIILVCREEEQQTCQKIVQEFGIKNVRYAFGGLERKDSVYNGICATDRSSDYIVIHDAARPFLSQKSLQEVITAAKQYGAAALGVRCKDTIKICESNLIVDTPDREMLWAVQTPQVFKRDLILEAFECANPLVAVTDDCSLVEAMGIHPIMVPGDYRNIKITTQDDLDYADYLMR